MIRFSPTPSSAVFLSLCFSLLFVHTFSASSGPSTRFSSVICEWLLEIPLPRWYPRTRSNGTWATRKGLQAR